jgi:hypothetical protein
MSFRDPQELAREQGSASCACPCDPWAREFDTLYCPTHGVRRKSVGEVRQEERDEVCLYVCTRCGQVADEAVDDVAL